MSIHNLPHPMALLALIAVLASSVLLAQQPALPPTPQGRVVGEYFRAFNSGTDSMMAQFFRANAAEQALKDRPIADRLERYHSMRQELQSIDLLKVTGVADGELTVLARAKNGDPLTLTFMFEGERFSAVRIDLGTRAPEPAGPPLSLSDGTAALVRSVEDAVSGGRFSGTVLVARDTALLLRKAYGEADKRLRVPNRVETRYNLGSINKLFTRIAIAQLAAAGKFSLADRLIDVLPDYPNRGVAERITVGQILEMRSGLGDFFGDAFARTPKDRIRTLRDYLQFFVSEPLLFEPGTQRRYSNAGYIVLGLIVERASGLDYYRYVQKNITGPAGMENTDWYEMDSINPNIATGYERADAGWRSNIYTAPARGSSAGGGYSTVDDLRRLLHALTAGTLLDARYSGWIFSGELPQAAPQLPIRSGDLAVAGGAPGINADIEFDASTGNTVIVLANYSPPSASDLAGKLFGILRRIRE